jgi:hypothetical protein
VASVDSTEFFDIIFAVLALLLSKSMLVATVEYSGNSSSNNVVEDGPMSMAIA